MAIEGVLVRRECEEKWRAILWDPVPQFSVSLNSQIFNFHDFLLFRQYSKGVQEKSNVSGRVKYNSFLGPFPSEPHRKVSADEICLEFFQK